MADVHDDKDDNDHDANGGSKSQRLRDGSHGRDQQQSKDATQGRPDKKEYTTTYNTVLHSQEKQQG